MSFFDVSLWITLRHIFSLDFSKNEKIEVNA